MVRAPASPEDPDHVLSLLHDGDDRQTRQVALLAAIVLHGILITATLPSLGRQELLPPKVNESPIRIQDLPVLRPPSVPAPRPIEPEALVPVLLPVPDPAPDAPEPIREPLAPATPVEPGPQAPIVVPDETVPPPSLEPLTPGVDRSVTFPTLIESSKVLPRYPRNAREVRLEGQVILRAVVRRDGSVGQIEVLRSPAPGFGFEEEAIRAVSQWRYHPGVQHGRPVDVYFTVVVDFVLE